MHPISNQLVGPGGRNHKCPHENKNKNAYLYFGLQHNICISTVRQFEDAAKFVGGQFTNFQNLKFGRLTSTEESQPDVFSNHKILVHY